MKRLKRFGSDLLILFDAAGRLHLQKPYVARIGPNSPRPYVRNDGSYDDITFHVYPFAKAAAAPFSFISNPSAVFGTVGGFSTVFAGTYDESIIETNIRITRSDIGIDKDDEIKVQSSGNKDLGSLAIEETITLAN